MRKILALLILMSISVSSVQAQVRQRNVSVTKGGAAVNGRVLDSESGEALVQCTVAVMSADTTKLITGTVTSEDGSFEIKNLAKGSYILKMSFVGYHNYYYKLDITETKGTRHLGAIAIAPASITLNQATVVGQLQEMEMKDDTVVYNADAFKMQEGAVVNDLIRKLPGVVIEDDGKIKVNGKELKRIMVDGKDFFRNDMKTTLENLPTNVINKLKVYDKESDFSRITGIDDGNEETVMDLTLKKGQNKGWMGDVSGAYGTRERWQGRVNARRFKEGFSTFIFGNMGNSDGRNTANGDNTNGSIGANMVFAVKDFEIGGSVQYRGSNSKNQSNATSRNMRDKENTTYSNSFNKNKNTNNNYSGNLKMEWKIDTLTTIVFTPDFSKGNSNSNRDGRSRSFYYDPYSYGIINPLDEGDLLPDSVKQNYTKSSSWNNSDNYNYHGNLMFNRRLGGKPWFGPGAEKGTSGRNFSITLSGGTSGSDAFNTNYNHVDDKLRDKYTRTTKDATGVTYRSTVTPNSNRNYTVGFSYNEPILRNLFAQVNYRYEYSYRNSDGDTYDFGIDSVKAQILWENYGQFGLEVPEEEWGNYLSDQYSKYTKNENYTHRVEFSLRYITKLLNISAGVNMERQHQKMEYNYNMLDTIASRNISRLSPTLNARFNFGRQHTLRLSYRGNTRQPEMTDMFNNTDKSNPMNIREGNPDLKPSFTNNVQANYQRFFMETKRSINARLAYSNTLNSITNRQEYNEREGSTVTRPENIDGNWNIDGNFGFNTPFIWEKLTFNTNTSASYRRSASYYFESKRDENKKIIKGTTYENEVITKNVRQNLSFSLRLEDIDIRTNGSVNWTKADNAQIPDNSRNTYNFRYGVSSTGNFSNGFGYSTDIAMNSRRGYTGDNANTNELVWNAEVSYRFLKRRATISLQAFDILQQRTDYNRRITETSISDSDNKTIYAFYMLRFQYRLTQFGDRRFRRGTPDFNAGERSAQETQPRSERQGGGGRFRTR